MKKNTSINNIILNQITEIQKDEINGYNIYKNLSERIKNKKNTKLLSDIADNEMEHYTLLKKYTKRDIHPSRFRIFIYSLMSRTLGLTFSLKLMEIGEKNAGKKYKLLSRHQPELKKIIDDEEKHEKKLLNMIHEEKLNYIGSIVLGLNDALVELSGALAGFTFAIQRSRTIALIGLITGIAATFSMAASEYLSQRQEADENNALKSSLYTGIAYIFTVILLVLPYFLINNPFISLVIMMAIVILIILFFNFYISVAKDLSFKKRFSEMALISLGVALLSFGIGWLVKTFWGLDI